MRLLFVNGHMRIGGGEKSLLDLLTHLDYNKHQVDLLLTEGRGEYFDMLPPQVNVRVIETGRAYGSFGKTVLTNLRSGQLWAVYYRLILLLCHCFGKSALCLLRPVFGLKKRYDCAIAYRPGPCADIVAHTICARRRICWWHNGKVDYSPEGIRQVDETWRHFDHVVAVSHGCRQMLAEHFNYPTEKIVVIPNMIDTERIKQLAGDRSPYPNDGRLNLVTVGRLCAEKRVDIALRAARLLIDDGFVNFCWHIIGDGEQMGKLVELASTLNLDDHVEFMGNLPNPYAYIKYADALIHTSQVESQCIAVLEAMALGTVCIVSRTMGPAEFMIDGVNGFLADQQFESTADCVIKYSTMPTKEKDSVKNHALATVLGYSPKHVVSSFSDILKM